MAAIRLNLGCGARHLEGYVNIDREPPADVVRDVLRGLPFADGTVEEVVSEDFLEHLPQTEVVWVMNEIWRVLRMGGTATHKIPLAGTDNDWGDPTHLSRWSENTITYFNCEEKHWKRFGKGIMPWKVVKYEVEGRGRAFEVCLVKQPLS